MRRGVRPRSSLPLPLRPPLRLRLRLTLRSTLRFTLRPTLRLPVRAALRARIGDEKGSTLPLTIFYGMLGLVLVLLVVAATSLYLERKRLFTLADGAALVGAEAFELDAVSVSGAQLRPTLDSAAVRAAVDGYLEENPVGDFEGLGVRAASTIDGKSATVTLTAFWRPPMVSLFVPAGFPIEVTAVARSVFR